MDAFLQFLIGEFTVYEVPIENWMLIAAGIFIIWIVSLIWVTKK